MLGALGYWKGKKSGMDRTRPFIPSGAASYRARGLPATQITIPRPSIHGQTLVPNGFAEPLWGVGVTLWLIAQVLVAEYLSMHLGSTIY